MKQRICAQPQAKTSEASNQRIYETAKLHTGEAYNERSE